MNKFEKVSFDQYRKSIEERFDCSEEAIREEYDDIKLPTRATAKSAGYDFFSPIDFKLEVGDTIKIPTGIRVLLDSNKTLICVPRSGLGFKYRAQLDNTVGVIDADYSDSDNEGHIFVKITNDGKEDKDLIIKKGEGICQGIILQYFTTVDDVADQKRNGGFGSTTK